MTIDERLDRLTERHEVLTQSVELMAAEGREIDRRLDRLTERHEALAQTVEILAADNREMAAENRERDRRMGEVMEGIARLLHIAEIHEHRIERLEGN